MGFLLTPGRWNPMASSFRGRHSLRLDPKGRFILPSGFRNSQKSKTYFITNNIHQGKRYLDLVPEKDWLSFEKRISEMPQMNTQVQAFRRFYLASAVPVKVDSQGRMLVPPDLRDFAELQEDIVLLGVGNKVEIWEAAKWSALQSDIIDNYEEILSAVSSFEQEDD